MTTNIATITAKGQITIPKAIRKMLGIQEQGKCYRKSRFVIRLRIRK